MHTALVSRLLREATLWEETTVEDETQLRSPAADVSASPMI
jgi:hypothetical protein